MPPFWRCADESLCLSLHAIGGSRADMSTGLVPSVSTFQPPCALTFYWAEHNLGLIKTTKEELMAVPCKQNKRIFAFLPLQCKFPVSLVFQFL